MKSMQPGPNAVTSVKVWNSPPRTTALIEPPLLRSKSAGLKFQSICPKSTGFNMARKSAKVTVSSSP